MGLVEDYRVGYARLWSAPEHRLIEIVQDKCRKSSLQHFVLRAVYLNQRWHRTVQQTWCAAARIEKTIVGKFTQPRHESLIGPGLVP